MTANHAHTPTTELVSSVYVQYMTRHGDVSVMQVKNGFDRWLATVEAAAEQRGAIKALRDAAQVLREDVDIVFNKHRGIFFREDEADRKGISPWAWLENRADRIADQEDD